jgi:hypothetical protein
MLVMVVRAGTSRDFGLARLMGETMVIGAERRANRAEAARKPLSLWQAALRAFAALSLCLVGLIAVSGPADAQSNSFCGTASSCTVNINNETFTITTISANSFSVAGTGPSFSYSATATFTTTTISIAGTQVASGQTTAIDCTINLQTGNFAGNCGFFFGQANSNTTVAAVGAANGSTRTQVETSVQILSNRIQAISRDVALGKSAASRFNRYSGIAAGDPATNFGVWFDGSGSYLSNNSSTAAYEGYGASGLGGIDYLYANDWLFGWDAGYARTDVLVKSLAGNRTADAAQTGPYVSYIFNKNFTADASVIYAHVFNTVAAGPASSNYDSNRVTTAINLNAFATNQYNFLFTGFIGWTYAYEAPSSRAPNTIGGSPTTIHYSAFRVGAELAYDFGNFEPYIPVKLSQETTQTRDGTGQFGVEAGVGLRYQLNDRLKIGVQATAEERNHSETALGSVNIRFVF